MAQWDVRRGRSMERLIAFSDAVVAVAITVQVLPLVEIGAPTGSETMLDVFKAHSGQITTFLFTFVIVAILWNVHNRVLNALDGYDSTIFWLDMFWLMGFAILPWPSALLGESRMLSWTDPPGGEQAGPGVPTFYWGLMAAIAFVGWLTSLHVTKHPELLHRDSVASWKWTQSTRARWRGLAFTALFVAAAVVTLYRPSAEAWVPVLILILGFALRPTKAQREEFAASQDELAKHGRHPQNETP